MTVAEYRDWMTAAEYRDWMTAMEYKQAGAVLSGYLPSVKPCHER